MNKWNPIFAAYAAAHGRTPAAQLDHDKEEWPGGCMCGFICWIAEKKAAFFRVCPEAFVDRHLLYDLTAWLKFLRSFSTL